MFRLKNVERVEILSKLCLEMLRRIHGNDARHPIIANVLGTLGHVYQSQGKLIEAEMTLRDSLEMSHEVYGRGVVHSAVANTLSNLGNVYRDQGSCSDDSKQFEYASDNSRTREHSSYYCVSIS